MAEQVSSSLDSVYSPYTLLAQAKLVPSSSAVQFIVDCVLYTLTGLSTLAQGNYNLPKLGQLNATSQLSNFKGSVVVVVVVAVVVVA